MTATDEEIMKARERLLDVLLEEELAGPAARRVAPRRFALLPAAAGASRLLAAAAVLLGLGVVAATAWLQRPGSRSDQEESWALPRQDPQEPGLVVIRDPDHFRQLLQQATAITLSRQEIRGAGQVVAENGPADQLDLVAWPETIRQTSGQDRGFEQWRAALTASLGERHRQTGADDILHLELELPDNRRSRTFVNVDGDSAWFAIDDAGAFLATGELERLLVDANREIERRHRVARGIVGSLAELESLPAETRRAEFAVAADFAPEDLEQFLRLIGLRELCLRGDVPVALLERLEQSRVLTVLELQGAQLDAGRMAALVKLTGLRALVLRKCTGLDRAAIVRLRALTGLELLHCIDTPVGEDGDALAGLASLPALREFGLRARGLELDGARLEPLLRTKLSRILLVDVQVSGRELAQLADLPSLRELTLVTAIDDQDLDSLEGLRPLRRLVIRNARVSSAGAAAFRAASPACELDWRPNARFFDTVHAFARE